MKMFDPNKARDMKTKHRLRMTFQQWGYTATFTEDVGGNYCAMSNLSCAIADLLERMPTDEHGEPWFEMHDRDDKLKTLGIEARIVGPLDEDKMMDMLVSVEVIALITDDKVKAVDRTTQPSHAPA